MTRRDTNKKYYENNKDKVTTKTKQWRQDNPEKTNEYARKYRAADPDKYKATQKKSQAKRKEQGICRSCTKPICSSSSFLCEHHHELNLIFTDRSDVEKRYSRCKRHEHGCSFTKDEFIEWFENEPKACRYCGIDASVLSYADKKQNTITIDRMDSGKGYDAGNVCLACFKCNNLKRNFFGYSDWMEIALRYIRPRLTEYHHCLTS